MDPSASLCIVYDSFNQPSPYQAGEITRMINTGWYSHIEQDDLNPHFDIKSINTNLPPIYTNVEKYQVLQRVKDAFDSDRFIEARNAMNPFEQIGRSIFINRAAIKLANIDAFHNVSGNTFTFTRKTSDQPFTFCDIAAGPGGFTQYLQYRFPNAIGYGMTLKTETLDWSTKFLDMTRFTPYYGPDNTGDLYTNWENFIKYVLSRTPGGVDLVTADGGFDIEDGNNELLHKQEFLSSRLLLTQTLVGIACTKIGGNFVLKLFDTVTDISAQTLYLLAHCFDRIKIFKPVSSRPANAENYLICIGRKSNVEPYYQLLAKAAFLYKSDMYLSSLFTDNLQPEFVQWLQSANVQSLERQLLAAQNILLFLSGQHPQIPEYNIHKFLIIWNLPDTPPNPRSVFFNLP